jgi:putative transposase
VTNKRIRGAADILIAVTEGLKGIGEAPGAVFSATTLQTCIVHLIRNSLDHASRKDRKLLATALRPVYTAASAEVAEQALSDLERGAWGSATQTSRQLGAGPGIASSRSSPSRPRFAAWSIPPTPSRA